jgi:hypothetical protein
MNEITGYNFCTDTLKLKKTSESSFLELGARLRAIRDGHLYEPQWTSFPEYLSEMDVSESQASKLINIYKVFIVEGKFPVEKVLQAKGHAVLAEYLPYIKTQEDREWALENATLLSSQDSRKLLKEKKTGVDMSECKHEDYYIIKVCRTCGDKESIHEDKTN